MKNLKSLLVLLCTVLALTSCKKNDNDDSVLTPVPDIKVTLAGQVVNENKQPVQGATVTAYGTSTISDAFGLFVFKDITISGSRCLMQITKAGYTNQYYAFKPTKAGRTLFTRPILIADDAATTITAITGGIVTLPGGAAVTFPANAFVVAASGAPYTGSVSVRLHCLNHNDSLYSRKAPGHDMRAIDNNQNEKILEPFSMVNVLLTSASGEALQLAGGKQATVTLPVANSQLGKAPVSVALWYFDEKKLLWTEEGSAMKQGNNYVGTVSHFTWWSAGTPYAIATMTGLVYNNCISQPQANADVFADNFYACTTDIWGEYSCDAPAQYPYPFSVYAEYYSASDDFYSPLEYVPVLTAGQVYTLPDLFLTPDFASTYVSGNIVDAAGNPTSGFVAITDGIELKDYIYTTSGNYTLACHSPSTVTVAAYENELYGHTTVSVPASLACSTIPVGNIAVTNTIPVTNPNFSITLTGFVFGTQTLNYHIPECHVMNFTNFSTLSFYGVDSINNSTADFEMEVPSYAPGTYSWTSGASTMHIDLNLNADFIEIFSSTTTGSSVVTVAPAVGGQVAASFSGPITAVSSNYGSLTGNASGSFNIYRVN